MQPLEVSFLSNADVNAISHGLDQHWGIRLRSHGEFLEELGALPDRTAVNRLFAAQAEAAAIFQTGSRKSELEVEREYFRAAAVPGLHGLITSRHRAWILDAIALMVSTVRRYNLAGTILDVGCHAGHSASVLAHHVDNPITGIDPLQEAIDFGLAHPGRHPRVQLHRARIPLFGSDRFSLILAVDAIPQKQKEFEEHVASYARNLEDGGIAILVSSGWDNLNRTKMNRVLRKGNLGCLQAGVLGGFGGANENEGNRFESRMVVMLQKGAGMPLPDDESFFDIATTGWGAFRDYANDPATPPAEKTQAFHWAKACAGADAIGAA